MKSAPAGFLAACTPEERQEQKKTALLANASIGYSILQAVRHVFGAHGSDVFRSIGAPAMEMEIQAAIERAVESAYYAGGRRSFEESQVAINSLKRALMEAKGRETLAQLGPLGPNGPGIHPLAPSDRNPP